MQRNYFQRLLYIVTTFVVTMLFSCESNFKNVSKIDFRAYVPNSEAQVINLQHTDSGRILATLKSPKMLDYSNVKNPFTEFPDGVHLTIYDANGKMSNIYAKYGVSYSDTKIIDLRDSVKIVTSDNKILETQQLYYNQKSEWFFTDKKCKFYSTPEDYSYFQGLDCSRDFKIVHAHALSGSTNINE